jgi:UDP-3-O-[3-hydroxymyristoyl] glucosamine N-acyltransferase
MTFTASQIALLVNGKVEGDANTSVVSFGKIEEAKSGDLAFLSNPKYEEYLYTTQASVILLADSFQLKQDIQPTIIRVQDAYSAFATLLAKYQEMVSQQLVGIQQPVYISNSARLGDNCFVAAFAYLGDNVKVGNNVKIYSGVVINHNSTIGDNCILYPGVKVYSDSIIGNNVIIHSGTIIGSDGFGFAPLADGSYSKIPQLGNVIIEDDVEIGANTTVDRATMGSTIIRKGTKLDNLIQVAHNAEIGSHTVVAAQAGISGSTKIGNNVMIGGQAGFAGHITVADGSKINAQSGVSKSIKAPNTTVTGTPAADFTATLRLQALNRNLPSLEKRIQELEKMIQELMLEKKEG